MITVKTNGNEKMKIRTSFRNTWTIQKQEGGRWGILADEGGAYVFQTRQDARAVARDLRNIRKNINIRVRKLTPA